MKKFTLESAISIGTSRDRCWNGATMWRVVLGYDGETMKVSPFHTMNGLPPTCEQVVYALISDADLYESGEWEACNYGMGEDELMAIENALESQTDALKDLLGDNYETLVYHTDKEKIGEFCS